MLGLPQLKPGMLRRRESARRGARRKSETKFAIESELLILISRTMKARFKRGARGDVRRKLPVNPVGKKSQMANHEGKDLTGRSLFMRALDRRTGRKKGLIDRDAKSQCSRQEVKMKELEEKYTRILHRVNGEDPKMKA